MRPSLWATWRRSWKFRWYRVGKMIFSAKFENTWAFWWQIWQHGKDHSVLWTFQFSRCFYWDDFGFSSEWAWWCLLKAVQYFDQNHYLYSRDFLIGSNGILGGFLIRIWLFLELMLRNLKSWVLNGAYCICLHLSPADLCFFLLLILEYQYIAFKMGLYL